MNLLEQLKEIKLEVEGFTVYSATVMNNDCFEVQIDFPECMEYTFKLSEEMEQSERDRLWEEVDGLAKEKADKLAEILGEEYCWYELDFQGLIDVAFGECDADCCDCEDCTCDEIDLDEEDILL